METRKITLYSTSTCGRCDIVKMMLDANNVPYTEIKDDFKLMEEMELENVPALQVDDELLDEYWKVMLWLKDNDYYSF